MTFKHFKLLNMNLLSYQYGNDPLVFLFHEVTYDLVVEVWDWLPLE